MKKIIIAIFAFVISITACDKVPEDSTALQDTVITASSLTTTEAFTTSEVVTTTETAAATEEVTFIETTVAIEETPDEKFTDAVENMVNMVSDGEFLLEFTMTADSNASGSGLFAMKNGKSKMLLTTEIEGQPTVINAIISDGKTYIIDDNSKSYLVLGEVIEMDFAPITDVDFKNTVKVGEGEGEVNGKILPFEEYENDGEKVKFHIDGDSIYALEVMDGDIKTFIIFDKISDDVSDDLFNLPDDYSEITF
jgi:hypothetical protein